MKLILRVLIMGLALVTFAGLASAEGDPEKGKKVYKRCKSCHQVGDTAKHKIGPILNDIIGRKAATVEGYKKYSKAMRNAGEGGLVWDEENLAKFLAKPKKFIKKTKMSFAGLRKQDQIDDVIAYLKTFSKAKADAKAKAAEPAQ